MTHTLSTRFRIVLVGALAAAALTACGQSDTSGEPDTASDPTSSATSEESTPTPGDSATATGGTGDTSTGGGAVLVAGATASTTTTRIISVSNAHGEVSPEPVPLGDPASLKDFVAPLGADLASQVEAAVRRTTVPDGQELWGAVVSVGCEEPTGIEIVQTFEGYEVTAMLPKSTVQCLVAVTSVALFLVESP
jgi:ABC-type transport system substrate-binding protein